MNLWPKRPLGDVAQFINGRAFKPTDWSATGIPIIRIQNLTDTTAPSNRFEGIFDKRHHVKNGDLLVSWSATLDVFVWDRDSAILNQHIFRVVPDVSKVDKAYLFYALKSVMDELRSKTHGSTMRHITKGPFEATQIPVPPLAVQKRIVELLDEVEELRRLRNKANKKTATLAAALFHEMFGDPRMNTARHELMTLGSLCHKISDGTHKTPTYAPSGVPFVTVKNIVTGKLDLTATKFISQQDHQELTKRTKPERGDILVSKDGTIGVPCPVDTDREFSIFVSVALLKLKKELINTTFLLGQLSTDWVQAQIAEGTKGIAIRHLHLRDFRSLKIVLPPMPLQMEFANRIAGIRRLQTVQADSIGRLDALFHSVLHRAFSGEL